MSGDARSGSRWEPEHGHDEAVTPPAEDPPLGIGSYPAWSGPAAVPPPPPAPTKNRRLAALTAAGLVLVGGAGGWAVGSAVSGGGSPSVQETSVDDPTGDDDVVPAPPGVGRLPDPGARGGIPDVDDDDGLVPPGSTGDDGPADDDGDAA
jgi:hypothetical protein